MSDQTLTTDGQRSHVVAHDQRLRWSTVIAYGAPTVGVGYMFLLLGIYVMKFATDVLLISPAIMATILGASRIWDSFFDPMAGYLSDRTQHRLGRRRIWILWSIVPICGTFVMMFGPPTSLTPTELIIWMAIAVVGFYSATSVFLMPHMSLGAEITDNYHERSKLFGFRHAIWTLGSILSLVTMAILLGAGDNVREWGYQLAIVASVITAALIGYCVFATRERPEFQHQTIRSPLSAFTDVWRNPHAKLLLIVTFIENVGAGAIAVLTLYVAQYVVGNALLGPLMILTYMVPSSASVPMWIPLSRRFGKIKLWLFSMGLTGVSFGGFFLLPFIDDYGLRAGAAFFFAFWAGVAAGCGGTVGPSVQSDIIDFDEYQSGERKEGAYFSAWSFVTKSAAGVIGILTGIVLDVAGYIPNVEQTMTVKVAIMGLYGLFPLACFTVGALLFSRFKLDEKEHERIRTALDVRRREKTSAAKIEQEHASAAAEPR